MRAGLRVVLFLAGCGVAGACAAVVHAGPAAHVQPRPHAAVLPAHVHVAGVRVGQLNSAAATSAIRTAFAQPLTIAIDGHQFQLEPGSVATAYVKNAVARARQATPGTNVQLAVSVHGAAVRSFVSRIAKHLDRKSVDASLTLQNGRPHVTPDQPGRHLAQGPVVAGIVHALRTNTRLTLRFTSKRHAPAVTDKSIGYVIVINRGVNRLTLYNGMTLTRIFPVATGQAIYPTPAGQFHIVVKWVNPWWYPPTYDDWAKGLQPVPPGPDNPLGTRWMGLSAPGIGIHGTDAPSSIGYSASHGCIRMQVPDAEWLFWHVKIGTTVFIV